VSDEGRQTWRELVIAGTIALAATLALLLDSRVESRAYNVGHAATYGPRVPGSGASGLAPLASRSWTGPPAR